MSLDRIILPCANNNIAILLPSDLPLLKWRQIRQYHIALKVAMEGEQVWPMENCAVLLEQKFRGFYRVLLNALELPQDIESNALHQLFVCTEPQEMSGQLEPGISWLEQLMGMSFDADGDFEEPEITTGDSLLDLLADACPIAETNARWLVENLSVEDLGKVLKQIGDRRAQALDEADKDKPQSIAPVEYEDNEPCLDPLFVANRDKIIQQLERLGIEVPHEF